MKTIKQINSPYLQLTKKNYKSIANVPSTRYNQKEEEFIMKNREEKKNRIWVPIVVGALVCSAAVGTGAALVHNQQRPKASTVATMSDAADFSSLTTEVTITTEEVTTEAVIEAAVDESEKPKAVATTTIGGGKQKAEETTEEQKPSTSSGASNSVSQKPSSSSNSGSSKPSTEAPKPSSDSTSSGSSGSGSTPATTEAPKPATTEAPTTQHQHVYDQVVVDTPAWTETIVHPAEYKTVPAVQCNTCYGVFTSYADFDAHATYGGGSCEANGHGGTNTKVKVKEETTEYVEHPAITHRECKCGARE